MTFKEFLKINEGGWFTDGQESEDSKKWYKKDPQFGDMQRKPGPGGPKGMGGGRTSLGMAGAGGGGMMGGVTGGGGAWMKKKMKKKQKKS